MQLILAQILARRGNMAGPAAELHRLYIERIARYQPCEARVLPSEERLLALVDELGQKRRPILILTDSRGKQLSSEEFAELLGRLQDTGTQTALVAIGPADGWSKAALARADHTIAFGRITLPHELAAVVAAEQMYRALTIRAGHPYHGGH